ncbi:MAG: ATP-binding protein, partial [Candidatus Omnitrophica bacterium]|nr:ATP-binding protein [Candidatus Omnitrophota bacterium]
SKEGIIFWDNNTKELKEKREYLDNLLIALLDLMIEKAKNLEGIEIWRGFIEEAKNIKSRLYITSQDLERLIRRYGEFRGKEESECNDMPVRYTSIDSTVMCWPAAIDLLEIWLRNKGEEFNLNGRKILFVGSETEKVPNELKRKYPSSTIIVVNPRKNWPKYRLSEEIIFINDIIQNISNYEISDIDLIFSSGLFNIEWQKNVVGKGSYKDKLDIMFKAMASVLNDNGVMLITTGIENNPILEEVVKNNGMIIEEIFEDTFVYCIYKKDKRYLINFDEISVICPFIFINPLTILHFSSEAVVFSIGVVLFIFIVTLLISYWINKKARLFKEYFWFRDAEDIVRELFYEKSSIEFIIKLLGSRNLEKREVAKDILKRFANIEIKNIQSKPYSAYKKAVAQFLVSLYELMENKLTEEERRIKIDNLINTLYSGYGRDFIELALKINDEAIREVALIVIAEFLKTSKNEVINEILSGLVNKYARHILNKTHSWRPIWQFLFGCFVSIFDIQRAKKNYLIPALITYQMNLEYLKSAHSIREAPNIVKLISGLLILREIFALFISTAQGLNEDGSINWHIWGDNKILTEECALRLAKKYNYHFEKLTCIIKTHENSLNELAGLLSQNKIVDFDFDKFYRQKYLSIRLQGKEFIFTIREKEDWIIIEVFDYIKTYSPKLHFVGHIDIRSSDNGMEIVTDFNCEGEENIPINKQIEDYLLRIGINRQNIEEAFNIKNRTEKVNAIEVNWNYRNRCLGSILMLCAFAIAYKKDIKTVDIFPYPYEKKEFYKKFIKEDSFLVVNRHIIGFIPESLKDKIKLKDSEIIIEGLRDGNIHFIIIPYEKIQTIFEKLIYIYLKIIINIRFIFQYILIRERSYKVTTIESAELNRITTGIINFIKGINFNNDKLWQLRLIIDELVTNIYKHANNIGIIIVRLLKQKEGIEVIARDYGPGFDLSRIKTKSEELEFKDSGRGLFIVISLADKTVILSKEIGKKAQKLTFTRQIISDSIEIKREFENRKLFIRGTEVRVIIYSNKRGLSNNKEKTDVSIKPLGLNCFINIGNIDFSKYPKACGINIYDENLHKMDYYSEYKTVEEINVAYKNNQVLTLEELKNYFAEYVNQEMDVPKALWELLEKYPQALYICPSILNEIRGPPVIWRLWSGDIKKCVFSCIYSKQIYIPVTLIVFLVENKKLYLLEDILNFESDNLFTYTEDILQGEKLAKRLLKLIGEEKLSGYDEYNKLLSGAKDAINLEFNKFDILSFEKSSEELNIPIGLELEINWDINKILRMQKLPYRIIKLPINLPQYPDECKNEPEISLNPTFNQTIQLWMVKEIKKELNLEDKDITSMQVNLGIESEIWDKCSKERKGKIINDAITLMWLTVMGFVSIERIKNKKTHKVVTLREKSKLNGRFYERLEYGFADIHNISFIVFALQYLHSALLNYHFIEEEVLDMYPEWKIRMAELWGKNIDFINSKINNLKLNTGIELNYAKNNRNNLIQYLNDHEEEREEIKNYLIKLIKNCKDIYENYKITPLIKEENKIIPSFSVKTIFYPCCGMDSDFVNLILNLFPYIENIYLLDNCSQFPLTLIKEDFSKMFKDKGYIIKREDNYKLNRLKYKIEYYNDENKKSIQLYFYKKNFNKKSKIPIKADLTIVKYPGWYGELSFKEVFYSNIFKNTKDAGYILINEAYLPSSKWGFVRKLEKIA